MKTAIQQHIEWLEEIRNKLIKSGDFGVSLDITDCILNAKSLLEKEKEQIIKTYIFANTEPYMTPVEEYAEQYYNETYGDDK